MLITTLVNSAVAWANYTCRSARETKKVELFRLIGKLIRSRNLQRVARKYVTIPVKSEDCGAHTPQAIATMSNT
jgi:hypothetical protein